MSKKPAIHVVPSEKGFGVKVEGNSRLSKDFKTKGEALEYGKDRAKQEKTELVSHRKDGTIDNKNSYGNDPHPPKDLKP